MQLSGKNAVVTGASSGLGREVSKLIADRGGRVFGLARRKEKLAETRAEVGDLFVPIVCDVTDEGDVSRAFSTIGKSADSIDILINNAGLGRFGKLDKLPLDEWDLQMATNLRGVFLCTRAVLGPMKKQNETHGFGGHIVNIASVAGLIGNPSVGAYNATKFGLRGLSESLMKEVREDGIKVTCVYPGSIETEFFQSAGVDITSRPMTAEDVASTVLHVLEAPNNYLISEVVMRPLRPKG